MSITYEQAQAAVSASIEAAIGCDTKMDIAVVDSGGHLKAFARMDGAWIGSIDIAIKKAVTAAIFETESGSLGEASQPGGPLFQIELSNGGLISFPGGVPIMLDGEYIGAVGVSGSSIENDRAVAKAGADAVGNKNEEDVAA